MFDDAAVFPPGSLPMEEAVPAHLGHLAAAHRRFVGAFVVAAKDLGTFASALSQATDQATSGCFDLIVTAPLDDVAAAVAATERIPTARVRAIEVALPPKVPADGFATTIQDAIGPRTRIAVFVEVPRDGRRRAVISALAKTPYGAKFRTGGVRADLFPDESELAGALLETISADVPFKATAGLHHALRNTDTSHSFEQHGFLNLLAATDVALRGADHATLVSLLAQRDAVRMAALVREVQPRVRDTFRSFGTCSIAEPMQDLADLGLISPAAAKDVQWRGY
ncbi:MAG: hypothetical protein ACRDT4_03650 [Micromonosporaceae bacterium]